MFVIFVVEVPRFFPTYVAKISRLDPLVDLQPAPGYLPPRVSRSQRRGCQPSPPFAPKKSFDQKKNKMAQIPGIFSLLWKIPPLGAVTG